jgi:hypothetical protein
MYSYIWLTVANISLNLKRMRGIADVEFGGNRMEGLTVAMLSASL